MVRALHLETSCRGGGEVREGGREGVVRALHLETSCRGGGEGREGGRVWSELYIWKRPAVEEVRGGEGGEGGCGPSSTSGSVLPWRR